MDQKITIGIGIVGCGVISHAHAFAAKEAEGLTLVGACSRSDSSAEKFCTEHQIRKFATYDDMLACPEIQAVSICTPSGDHCTQILKALDAGKHVVVEKPMCITLEDCDKVIRRAEETGLTVCVIFQNRFSDGMQEIRRAIQEGETGKIYSAQLTMHYFRPQSYYDSASWRGTWELDGGGVLMNQGIHGVDMLCYFLGPAKCVTGFARTQGRNIEVEDTAAAAVLFESGAIGTIDASTCCAPGFPQQIVLNCEKGRIVTRDDTIAEWTLPTPCRVPLGVGSAGSGAGDPRAIFMVNHQRQLQNFADSLLKGAQLNSDARSGKQSLEIILGLYKASRGSTLCGNDTE